MPVNARNLAWLRGLKDFPHDFGSRMHEMVSDVIGGVNTVEQQTNSNIQGDPPAPTQPDQLRVVPHPNGVQFAIRHDSEFYQGINYEVDYTSGGVTHTHDAGSSRNGFIPNGPITASYQVRARYPNGLSSTPRVGPTVTGGTGSADLLPSEGAGTTKRGQPPGFGGAYRGSTPPPRNG